MRILVLTDSDLDGAGSALFIKWLYKDKLTEFVVIEVTETILINEFTSREQTLDGFDKVFILDLDLKEEHIRVVDKPGVVIFDHHNCHSKNKHLYNHAKVIVEPYSSCMELMRDKFSNTLTLTPQQEELVKYVDDYDSFKLQYGDSLKLNAVHSTYNRPKAIKFIEAFEAGFRPYNIYEKNSMKLFLKKFKDQLQNQVFIGKIKDYKVVSVFANFAVSEVAHYLITKHNADIGIVVNLDAKVVSFRRSKTCEADVSILAKTLCNGGGSAAAGGGDLTPEFASITKNFTPC